MFLFDKIVCDTPVRYCTNCTIYLAVYGFIGGRYSILASQGLTRLQEGLPQQGAVQPGGDEYYAFINPAGRRGTVEV
ncbi:unnamed protein product, partial [Discosporangium mesarthrocarpum]